MTSRTRLALLIIILLALAALEPGTRGNVATTHVPDAAASGVIGPEPSPGDPAPVQRDIANPLLGVPIDGDTADKPQSKVWFHDDTWWAVLPSVDTVPVGTWIWRLETDDTWTNVLHLSAGSGGSDAKVVGDVVHILRHGTGSELISAEYVPGANTYQLWPARPTATAIPLPDCRTATIDIDSTGRLWLATECSPHINVHYSDFPYSSFSGPISLADNTGTEMSVVVALPNDTVGVLWSDHITQRYGFRVHVDGTDPATWLANEVPAFQSALNVFGGMSDDHVNVAVSSDGTLYAAVKTEYDSPGYPVLALLVRRPDLVGPGGTWDDLHVVDYSQVATRPIVLLNEDAGKLQVIYRGGSIVLRESLTAPIQFGSRQLLMPGDVNNPTSTKTTWSNEVVILASSHGIAEGVRLTRDTNLVGHWTMNEQTGVTILDHSGQSHDGDLFGGVSRPIGVDGLALGLDGAGEYARVIHDASLEIASEVTLSAWVRPGAVAAQRLIDKEGTASGYALFLDAGGTLAVRFNENNAERVDSSTLYSSRLGEWIHVAATYDGSTIRLYVDGVEESTLGGNFAIGASGVDLGLGATGLGVDAFQGNLDEVRVYDRALAADEILDMANAPSVGELVGHWKMEEGAGDRLFDTSGHGNEGWISGGPGWTSGVEGLAFGLDGVNDIAVVPDAASLHPRGTITLAAWIRPEIVATQRLLRKVGGLGQGDSGYSLYLDDLGKLAVRFNGDDSLRLVSAFDYSGRLGEWIHVAATYDGTTISLYVDGSLDSTLAAGFTIEPPYGDLSIGAAGAGNQPFRGSMDEARVYDRALSSVEIEALANIAPPAAAQLIGLWKMEEGSGALLLDSSGQSNHAALSGGPSWEFGIDGLAVTLDGVADHGSVAHSASVDLQQALTLAGWVRPEVLATQQILDKSGSAAGYSLFLDAAGTVSVRFNENEAQKVTSTRLYTPGQWMHVTATYDGMTARLYIDGVQDAALGGSFAIGANTEDLGIGASAAGGERLQGSLDELQIYDSALGPDEILTLASTTPNVGTLVGHWEMEEGAGTKLQDSSINDNDAILSGGAGWAAGVEGLAFLLDGATGQAQVADDATLDLTNTISVAAWVRPEVVATQRIVDKFDGATGYALFLDASGSVSVRFNGDDLQRVDSAVQYSTRLGDWMHVAASYDGSTIRLFIDGILDASLAAGFMIPGNAASLGIGASSTGTDLFQGRIDDIRLFDRRLNATEIQLLASTVPPTGGLVAEWKMEQGFGLQLSDSSGNGNDAVLSGALDWVTGVEGLALDVGSAAHHAVVPHSSTLDVQQAITLAAWIRPDSLGTQRILRKVDSGAGYSLFLNSLGEFSVRFNDDSTLRLNSSPYVDRLGQWTHVAATYDGLSIRLFIDGIQDDTKTSTFAIGSTAADLSLGATATGQDRFDGLMDEVRVYSRALGPDEIQDLAGRVPSAPVQMVGEWKMDEGAGTVLLDSSGLDNHASLVGSPTWLSGVDGMALELDGLAEHGLVPNDASLDLQQSITLAAWVRPETLATQRIVDKTGGSTGYSLFLDASGAVSVRFNQDEALRVDSALPYSLNEWVHVAATYDGLTARLYLDGQQNATLGESFVIAGNVAELCIGASSTGSEPLQGRIDEVQIYDGALAPAEVQALAAMAPNLGDPEGHWKMEEGSGAQLLDSSGKDNHANLFGAPDWVTGVDGLAVRLAANGDYAVAPHSATLDIQQRITLAAWVLPDIVDTQRILHKVDGATGYSLFLNGSGKFSVRFNGDNLLRLNSISSYASRLGQWIHVAATFDGATIRLYIDGIEDSAKAASFTIAGTTADLGIGASATGVDRVKGSLDDARIYDHALGLAGVQALAAMSPPAAAQLKGLWKMEEGSGLQLLDSSGQANHAALSGAPSWELGVDGLALTVDGAADHGSVPHAPSVDLQQSITLAGWVRPEVLATQRILDKSDIATGYSLFLDATGTVSARFNQNEAQRATSTTLYSPGQWTHVAATYDGTTVRLYVDGAQEASLTDSFAIAGNTVDLGIGAMATGGDPLAGSLDELRIYDGALGPDEILTLASITPNIGELVGHWKMEEGTGTQLSDSSGTGNHATLSGGAGWAAGFEGLALLADGVTGQAQVGDDPSLDPQHAITIAAWVRPEIVATQRLLSKVDGAAGYSLFLDASGSVSMRLNGDELQRVDSSVQYGTRIGTWMHVAATYDGSSIRLYIDGVEDSALMGGSTIATTSTDLFIGASGLGTEQFQGRLDDVRLYNFKLQPAEILALAGGVPPMGELVAHWSMDGSTTQLLDATGKGNHASLVGSPGWVPGIQGLALDLDGAADYAIAPHSPSLDVQQAITLAAWIRPDVVGTQRILRKVGTDAGYSMFLSSLGEISVRFNDDATLRLNSNSPYATRLGEWIHVAATYDGLTIRLFVDGVQDDTRAATLGIAGTTADLSIGANTTSGNRLQGLLDEVRIYNRALGPDEIAQLATAGSCNIDLDCDDFNPCTTDSCDVSGYCVNAFAIAGTSCSDGDACNGDEICDGAGSCGATPLDCDDSDACTADSCHPIAGCVYTPIDGDGDGAICGLDCDDSEPAEFPGYARGCKTEATTTASTDRRTCSRRRRLTQLRQDCDDSDPKVWLIPGQVSTLVFEGYAKTVSWQQPPTRRRTSCPRPAWSRMESTRTGSI